MGQFAFLNVTDGTLQTERRAIGANEWDDCGWSCHPFIHSLKGVWPGQVTSLPIPPIPSKRRGAWDRLGESPIKALEAQQRGLLCEIMANKGETSEDGEFIWHATREVFSTYTVPEPTRVGLFDWDRLPEVVKNEVLRLARLPGYNRGGKQQFELWENVHTELSFLPYCPNLLRVLPVNGFDFPLADQQDWENPVIRCYKCSALHVIFT